MSRFDRVEAVLYGFTFATSFFLLRPDLAESAGVACANALFVCLLLWRLLFELWEEYTRIGPKKSAAEIEEEIAQKLDQGGVKRAKGGLK